MTSEDQTNELLEQFESGELCIPSTVDEDHALVECDCEGHERRLREGNLATVLVTRSEDDGSWGVVGACCTNNSIRDMYERTADNSTTVAVVEGTLHPRPAEENNGQWDSNRLSLYEPVVWDIHTPAHA